MPRQKTADEAYDGCVSDGSYLDQEEVDKSRIEKFIESAGSALDSVYILKESAGKNPMLWNSIYKLHYDALRELIDAFLRFDKVKVVNHQCLFAYLCIKHPELEFDWNFFEKIRTKRNGINYYGVLVGEKDYKEVELQLKLYINKLKDDIKKKLNK